MNKKIILGVVVVIVLGVGSYIAYGSFFGRERIQNCCSDTFPPATPLPSTQQDEKIITTTNWKTYKNPQLKYEVSYPADWKIDNNTGGLDTSIGIYSPNNKDDVSIDRIFSKSDCYELKWEVMDGIEKGSVCISDSSKGNLMMRLTATPEGKKVVEKIASTLKFIN